MRCLRMATHTATRLQDVTWRCYAGERRGAQARSSDRDEIRRVRSARKSTNHVETGSPAEGPPDAESSRHVSAGKLILHAPSLLPPSINNRPIGRLASPRPPTRGHDAHGAVVAECDNAGMAVPTSRRAGQVGRPGYDLDSLLAVAVTVFNQRGYDGTSMDHLAAKLGISKSSIYHHVAGKSELLRLGVSRALDRLFAATEQPDTLEGPAIDRLENLVRRSIPVLVAELPYVTLLLRVRGNTPVERRALARRREFDHIVGELVQAASDEGSIRSDADPDLTSRLIFGTVNSLVEWYRPSRGLSADDLADAVVTMMFDGLRVS
jgi:AcrR family transcriptional regulator